MIRRAYPRLARRSGSPTEWVLLVAASAAVAAATWILSDHSLVSLAVSIVSVGGAGLAVWLVPRNPGASFGVLLLLATASVVTLELPPGTMRLEQPGILAVGLALVAARRAPVDRTPIVLWVGVAALAYVLVLAASSALLAPVPLRSLIVTGWTALSIVGGAVAYVLLGRDPAAGARWLLIAGLVTASAGTLSGLLFWLFGPGWNLGIHGAFGPLPRVAGFAWEPNLYASFLAAIMVFAAAPLISRPTPRGTAALAFVLLAMGLAFTRGAYLGLAAGTVALLGLAAWRLQSIPRVALVGVMIATFAAAGIGLYAVTLQHPGIAAQLAPPSSDVPGGEGPLPSTVPALVEEYPDTLSFRLVRVPIALDDLAQSPLIGLGAASFGQRHLDPSRPGMPDHIAILAVAALYEAGVIGAAALVLVFAMLAVALMRALAASVDPHDVATTAAYAAAIAALLVAYQATNAIHFALNWLLIGAALAWTAALLRRQAGQAN